MTWNSTSALPRGWLARHLGRLQQNLDAVGEQVREAVANAVGRSVAEAVGETVYDALHARDGQTSSATPFPARFPAHASSSRRAWDEPAWDRDAGRSDWREAYDDDGDDSRDDDWESAETPSPQNLPPDGRGSRAVAVGLQAAAWWLQRHPGQVSLLAALTVGAVVGLTVLAGPVSGIAGVAASALGLAYLLDLVRSAGLLFAQHNSP